MIGVWFCRVMMVLALSNLILDVLIGDWLPLAPDVLAAVLFFAGQRTGYRVLARRDLREVYPPRRDRFQRDLERLNKLRGAPADAKRPEPGRTVPELVIRASSGPRGVLSSDGTYTCHDDPAVVLKQHREQLEKEWREIEFGRRRGDDALGRAFVPVLEGVRDGFRLMAPFLVVILFGAVIGLVASLL